MTQTKNNLGSTIITHNSTNLGKEKFTTKKQIKFLAFSLGCSWGARFQPHRQRSDQLSRQGNSLSIKAIHNEKTPIPFIYLFLFFTFLSYLSIKSKLIKWVPFRNLFPKGISFETSFLGGD